MPLSLVQEYRQTLPSQSGSRSMSRTTSPCALNLIVLPARLTMIWRSRTRSTSSRCGISRGDGADHFEPLAMSRQSQRLQHLIEVLPEVEWNLLAQQLAGLDLGEIKDVVDDRQQASEDDLMICRYSRCSPLTAVDWSSRSLRSPACVFRDSYWPGIPTLLGWPPRPLLWHGVIPRRRAWLSRHRGNKSILQGAAVRQGFELRFAINPDGDACQLVHQARIVRAHVFARRCRTDRGADL